MSCLAHTHIPSHGTQTRISFVGLCNFRFRLNFIFQPTLPRTMFRPTLQQHIRALFVITRPQLRNYAEKRSGAITTAKERTDVSTDVKPIGERIKENTKTASYMGVIVLGVGVTGALFYTVLKELWSSNSPNNIYSAALDRCVNDTRIQDQLGAPIKGFGEETRRGRRQHVAHTNFERNGIPHMRMQFYIQGIRNKATVHLEMKQVSSISYQ